MRGLFLFGYILAICTGIRGKNTDCYEEKKEKR